MLAIRTCCERTLVVDCPCSFFCVLTSVMGAFTWVLLPCSLVCVLT